MSLSEVYYYKKITRHKIYSHFFCPFFLPFSIVLGCEILDKKSNGKIAWIETDMDIWSPFPGYPAGLEDFHLSQPNRIFEAHMVWRKKEGNHFCNLVGKYKEAKEI